LDHLGETKINALGNREMVTHLGDTKTHISQTDLLGFWQRLYLDDLSGSGIGCVGRTEMTLGFWIEVEIEKVAEGF
jgi:hypothetical protein